VPSALPSANAVGGLLYGAAATGPADRARPLPASVERSHATGTESGAHAYPHTHTSVQRRKDRRTPAPPPPPPLPHPPLFLPTPPPPLRSPPTHGHRRRRVVARTRVHQRALMDACPLAGTFARKSVRTDNSNEPRRTQAGALGSTWFPWGCFANRAHPRTRAVPSRSHRPLGAR
jgi:hypothetical protein